MCEYCSVLVMNYGSEICVLPLRYDNLRSCPLSWVWTRPECCSCQKQCYRSGTMCLSVSHFNNGETSKD